MHARTEAFGLLSPAETIVQEVYEVVDQHFLDARDGGYSSERWQELRKDALRDLGKGKRGEEEDARRLAKRMLKRGIPSGDPYTRLLMPDEFERLSKYDVSGVGLNLGTREEYEQRVGSARDVIAGPTTTTNNAVAAGYDPFVVLGVVIHSPAEEAGIRQGDRILSIDGEAPAGLTPMQAAQRIKDARSAETRLRVMRASDGSVAEVAVPRGKDGEAAGGAAGAAGDLVRWAQGKGKSYPVDFKMRKGKDGAREGYVNLKEFTARAPAGVREALKQLDAEGADYFVLDLRDNLGGLVPAGVEISRLFLGSDAPVVYTMTKGGGLQDRVPHPATYQPPLTDKPLVLLVNKSTASASEIVAGALKDNCRASLAGDTTFGKGLIQSVYELSDGSGLVVTVGKYVTPSRLDIDRHGISASFKTVPTMKEQDEYIRSCRVVK